MKTTVAIALRSYLWMGAVMLGVLFIGLGAFFVFEGFAAKDTVQQALVAEQATTSGSAVIPDAPIVNIATAEAQENLITEHTLGTLGPYSQLERGSDDRATYLDGLTIRNSLNMAVMGFRVSDLVIGVGAVILLLGATSLLLLAPVLYWAREPVLETAGERARLNRLVAAQASGIGA